MTSWWLNDSNNNWLADTGTIISSGGYWDTATSGTVNNWTLTNKPSVLYTADFTKIYDAVNPANEIGVVAGRVFHSAPQESWNPKTGAYSYSIEWTYERTV
jgi:hypothetical protein